MNKEEITKEIAVEIATKYANDIWLFGEVDKECVSEVCKVLLSELDIANNKLNKIKEKTEFDMKMWSKEDGFILINGNEILSIIGE